MGRYGSCFEGQELYKFSITWVNKTTLIVSINNFPHQLF